VARAGEQAFSRGMARRLRIQFEGNYQRGRVSTRNKLSPAVASRDTTPARRPVGLPLFGCCRPTGSVRDSRYDPVGSAPGNTVLQMPSWQFVGFDEGNACRAADTQHLRGVAPGRKRGDPDGVRLWQLRSQAIRQGQVGRRSHRSMGELAPSLSLQRTPIALTPSEWRSRQNQRSADRPCRLGV
jgi:hypothetical protein